MYISKYANKLQDKAKPNTHLFGDLGTYIKFRIFLILHSQGQTWGTTTIQKPLPFKRLFFFKRVGITFLELMNLNYLYYVCINWDEIVGSPSLSLKFVVQKLNFWVMVHATISMFTHISYLSFVLLWPCMSSQYCLCQLSHHAFV